MVKTYIQQSMQSVCIRVEQELTAILQQIVE